MIEWWIGDHLPKHVHIYEDGKEIVKIRIPEMIVLTGRINKRILKILAGLVKEGVL